jgi:hypothetical protein
MDVEAGFCNPLSKNHGMMPASKLRRIKVVKLLSFNKICRISCRLVKKNLAELLGDELKITNDNLDSENQIINHRQRTDVPMHPWSDPDVHARN